MVRVRFRVMVRVRDAVRVRVMVRLREKLLDYNSVHIRMDYLGICIVINMINVEVKWVI